MHDCCRPPAETGGTCRPFGRNQHPLGGGGVWEGGRWAVSQQTGSLRSSFLTIYCSDHTEKACRARGNRSFQCADYRRMIVFCVFRKKLHANLNALRLVFRDRWQFLLQRRPLLCFQETGQTRMKMRFCFFSLLFLFVFFNLCGFKRKLHTAEGCGRFSCYLSVKVVFKKIFPSPSAQHSQHRRSCRFPYFHR